MAFYYYNTLLFIFGFDLQYLKYTYFLLFHNILLVWWLKFISFCICLIIVIFGFTYTSINFNWFFLHFNIYKLQLSVFFFFSFFCFLSQISIIISLCFVSCVSFFMVEIRLLKMHAACVFVFISFLFSLLKVVSPGFQLCHFHARFFFSYSPLGSDCEISPLTFLRQLVSQPVFASNKMSFDLLCFVFS